MMITYNVPITFGKDGTAQRLNCIGIDFSETGSQSWTCADVAEMDISLPPARHDIVMQIDAMPFVIPDIISTQQVFVHIGGFFIGFWRLQKEEMKAFQIPRPLATGRPARLALAIPAATSPSESFLNEDTRKLGIRLAAITFQMAA